MAVKYIEIADCLRGEIREGVYSESRMLPTEQRLSERFGVSRQTIRQAIALLVNEGMVVRRQGSGSYITDRQPEPKVQRPRTIAVVTTYISNYIFPHVLRSVQEVLSRSNCTTVLYDTQNQIAKERSILQQLLAHPVDGILMEGTKTALPNPNLDLYRRLQQTGVPIVFFNGCYRELEGTVFALDDNYGGGYALADYLIGQGHRRIAGYFKSDDIQGIQRYNGYISALKNANLLMESSPVFWFTTESERTIVSAGSVEKLRDCTGVVCYNDTAAFRLIDLLGKAGIRVPEDIAVVSFDNSHYSEMSPIKITSLSHDGKNTGYVAAEKLLQLMDHPGQPVKSEYVEWTLHEKASSAQDNA